MGRFQKIALILVIFFCMIFANFYAVRKLFRYGTEVYLYDKLLVAYNLAGRTGLEEELKSVFSDDKFRYELALAEDFKVKLKEMKDPRAYLSARVIEGKKKVILIRDMRTAAIILLCGIFVWKLIVNFGSRVSRKCRDDKKWR